MAEHKYEKQDLINRFESIKGKTFGEIDDKGLFEHVKNEQFKLQKGIAGHVVEQCVLNYPPDSKQEADLVVVDGDEEKDTELKVTGLRKTKGSSFGYKAKEPMSITAVGIYDLPNQTFYNSHFWNKLEHMLIVYYDYLSDKPVSPYDYKNFPVLDYEFHEFGEDDLRTLQQDWLYVFNLVKSIADRHPGPHDMKWKSEVREEYLAKHSILRQFLSYIDLAPKYPPRFRLKQTTVNAMIEKHFTGRTLEPSHGCDTVIEVDQKCRELEQRYAGKTIAEIAKEFGVQFNAVHSNKNLAEQVITKMFGDKAKKINSIGLFKRFGLIAKTITVTPQGKRTEDMKLFKIDFEDICRKEIIDEDGIRRPAQFEDSELYRYFADHEMMCVVFEQSTDDSKAINYALGENKFVGFQRLVFSDDFIDNVVKRVWLDTRDKILNDKLRNMPSSNKRQDGSASFAPNFIKSTENVVFIRGGANDSSDASKTEVVNGIHMIPQYVWIKGVAVVDELKKGKRILSIDQLTEQY